MRPRFEDPRDERRRELVETRAQILDEDWEVTALLWNQQHLGDRSDLIGPPDLTVNALSEICRQLSTPGLHGQRPKVTHPDAEAAAWLIEPGVGHLDRAGVFSKLQQVEYFALGLGDMFVCPDVTSDGQRIVARLVRPHHVEVVCDREDPTRAVVLRELGCRVLKHEGEWRYTWDEWDIRDRDAPKYRVLDADRLLDLTSLCESPELLSLGYRWRYADDEPFIPHEQFFWRDTGEYWHHQDMRGLTKGTLDASMFATLVRHTAFSVSGQPVLAAGIEPIGGEIVKAPDGQEGVQHRTVSVQAGSVIYHKVMTGGTPWAMQIGGDSAGLRVLADTAWEKQARLCQAFGINPSDALRTTANPTSGVALSIEQRGRREFSAQIAPLWQRSTQNLIRKFAAIVRRRGGPQDLPDDGYSVTHHQIPLSAVERKEQREHVAAQRDRGLISQIDEYQLANPGTSRSAAIEALIRVRLDQAELEERFAALAGPPVPPPAPPVTDPPTPATPDPQ